MREKNLVLLSFLAIWISLPKTGIAQDEPLPANGSKRDTPTLRLATLPTDRTIREDAGLEADPSNEFQQGLDFKRLLRPRVALQVEWEPEVSELVINSYDLSLKMPVYPVFGPPPPFITVGYSFTDIESPPEFDLPQRLHDVSFGLAWMRRINDKWMARFMLNTAFASDLNNTGSDAWQVRAGGFAVYRPNERWSFALGALATGRDDIPVIPAVGAIWNPSPKCTVNLMLPNPRIARVLYDSGNRLHWGYIGGGFSGGTWAYDRSSGLADRLTYREWRLVLGWESTPPKTPGTFYTTGKTLNFEFGYVFGRKFEFDQSFPDLSPSDGWLLRTGVSF